MWETLRWLTPWNNPFGHYEDVLLSLLVTNKSPCVVIWKLTGGTEKSPIGL